VFPQNYVSRRQAVIRCVNGMYFLEQTGSCPIAVNEPSRVVERNRIVRLAGGDRILIDDIEIRLQEIEGPVVEPERPVVAAAPAAGSGMRSAPEGAAFGAVSRSGSVAADPLVMLGITSPVPAPAPTPAVELPKSNSPLQFAWPEVPPVTTPNSSGAALSDNWWSQTSASPGGTSAPAPPVSASVPAPVSEAASKVIWRESQEDTPHPVGRDAAPCLEDILKGAGLDSEARLAPEVALQLGEALRIVVEGTMQVLQARNNIRKEFRLPTTQVARKDNNPLKFSADAADALHKLLVQRSPAYLDTVRAFADAFDDIRAHQTAMLEALRSAFDHMLKQFDPEELGPRLTQRGARGSVLGLGKPNPWELYAARFKEWSADPDFAFRQLFGEEFGKAYEQHLAQQKRTPGKGGNG
jgi:type VI secretion system protein ImpI